MKIASFCISFYKIKKYSTMVSFSELNLHSRSRQPSDLYLQLYFLEEFKVCIRISSNWSKNIQKKIFTLTFCRQKRKKNTHYILYQVTNIFCYWNMNEQFMKNTKKKYHKFHNRVIQRNLCILCKLIINAFKFIWKKHSMKSLNFIFVEKIKINQQCPLCSTSLADVKKKRKTTKYPKVPKQLWILSEYSI